MIALAKMTLVVETYGIWVGEVVINHNGAERKLVGSGFENYSIETEVDEKDTFDVVLEGVKDIKGFKFEVKKV